MPIGDNIEDGLNNIEKAFGKLTGQVKEAFEKVTSGDGAQPAAAAFFFAVKRNKLAEVKKFIDAKTDLNAHNDAGDTALHIAAKQGLPEMAQMLLDHGADPRKGRKDEPQQLPIDDAVNFGKTEMVALLTRNGGYIPGNTVDGRTLLHRAVEKGKPGMVEAMINAGADANEMTPNGTTPLLLALAARQEETAVTLLQFPDVIHGINTYFTKTDPRKRTAFQIAIERGMARVADKMLEFGADVNARDDTGATPMEHAIAQGNLALVKTLFFEGADLNRDTGRGTALYLAASTPEITDAAARAQIVAFMLRHGADPDIPSQDTGQTALAAALQAPKGDAAADEILKYRVNTEAVDKSGATALFYALDRPEMTAKLLAAGANPNARHMEDARTPLMQAVKDAQPQSVISLLAKGANPRLIDAHDKSAMSYALETRNSTMGFLISDALKKGGRKPGFQEFSL